MEEGGRKRRKGLLYMLTLILLTALKVKSINVSVTIPATTNTDDDVQFIINLLLNLMRARATGGKVYASLLDSYTVASRKRAATLVLLPSPHILY